ncbi:MAG: hypothetical protein JW768_01235 [Chitinispirillaceae bacterium]|nr:hypothetical protein [Chitinispirillaceae bacterium]
MNIFESIKQGVVGLLLFTGNWILPPDDNATLALVSADKGGAQWVVVVRMEIDLNRQLEQLIDAGVPLNFRFTAVSDNNDTVSMVRSLRCNVADLTYSFSDSLDTAVTVSRSYPMILLAMRDFARWKFRMPGKASACDVEAEILYSRVSQLDRSVDMSRIWGHQKLQKSFTLAGEKK